MEKKESSGANIGNTKEMYNIASRGAKKRAKSFTAEYNMKNMLVGFSVVFLGVCALLSMNFTSEVEYSKYEELAEYASRYPDKINLDKLNEYLDDNKISRIEYHILTINARIADSERKRELLALQNSIRKCEAIKKLASVEKLFPKEDVKPEVVNCVAQEYKN